MRRDLDLLRGAVGDADADQVFVCAVAPSGVGGNEYYPSQADYLNAVADALHVEYAAIVEAGFTLQIDESQAGPSIAWSRSLSFPGLQAGELLSRDTSLPERAALLARDGSVLAEAAPGRFQRHAARNSKNRACHRRRSSA